MSFPEIDGPLAFLSKDVSGGQTAYLHSETHPPNCSLNTGVMVLYNLPPVLGMSYDLTS